jgi:prepilin peptidase CpaA
MFPVPPIDVVMAWLLAGMAVTALGLACWQDLATRLIANALCALILACGLGLRLLQGDLLPSLLASLLVFVAALSLWWPGWLGGGDVKLLAAVAALPSPAAVPGLLLAVALAGGLLAALYLLLHRRPAAATPRPARLLPRVLRAEARRIRRGGPLPYGLAIGAGTLATTLATWGGG